MRVLEDDDLRWVAGGFTDNDSDGYDDETGLDENGRPHESDIVVTGYNYDYWSIVFAYQYLDFLNFVNSCADGGGYNPFGYWTPPATTPQSTLDQYGSGHAVNLSTNTSSAVDHAIVDMKKELLAMMTTSLGKSNSLTLGYNGGSNNPNLTQATLQDTLARVQFDIVDTTFGSGRAGANLGLQSDGLIHIQVNVDSLLQFDAMNMQHLNGAVTTWGNEGINWLIGHEIGHYLPQGAEYNQIMYDAFWANSTDHSDTAWLASTYFAANERYANDIGKAITDDLGLLNRATPEFGYN